MYISHGIKKEQLLSLGPGPSPTISISNVTTQPPHPIPNHTKGEEIGGGKRM